MKKSLLSLLVLGTIGSSIECATVRIHNKFKKSNLIKRKDYFIKIELQKGIRAQINNQTTNLGMTSLFAKPRLYPNFKFIKSDSSTFFDSGFNPIKKITFRATTNLYKYTTVVHPTIGPLVTEAGIIYYSPEHVEYKPLLSKATRLQVSVKKVPIKKAGAKKSQSIRRNK